MTRLTEVSLDELRRVAESFDDHRSLRRLFAAILYKKGASAPTIADWFDVRPATVYGWFDRLESAEDYEAAVTDDPRPGRPPKLRDPERGEFIEQLKQPPSAVGFESKQWSPRLAGELLESRYSVHYSRRHVRRLLRQAEAARY